MVLTVIEADKKIQEELSSLIKLEEYLKNFLTEVPKDILNTLLSNTTRENVRVKLMETSIKELNFLKTILYKYDKQILSIETVLIQNQVFTDYWKVDFFQEIELLKKFVDEVIVEFEKTDKRSHLKKLEKLRIRIDKFHTFVEKRKKQFEESLKQEKTIKRKAQESPWRASYNEPSYFDEPFDLEDVKNAEEHFKKADKILEEVGVSWKKYLVNAHFLSVISLNDVIKKLKKPKITQKEINDLLKDMDLIYKKLKNWHQLLEDVSELKKYKVLVDQISIIAVEIYQSRKSIAASTLGDYGVSLHHLENALSKAEAFIEKITNYSKFLHTSFDLEKKEFKRLIELSA